MRSTCPFQIAIDGPSGVGKSTTASALAARLGFSRIDSGTLYRSLTYILLKKIKKENAVVLENINDSGSETSKDNQGNEQTSKNSIILENNQNEKKEEKTSYPQTITELNEKYVVDHTEFINDINLDVNTSHILYAGNDIKPYLKSCEVEKYVSLVAKLPFVREKIKNLQHSLIEKLGTGVVIDGRDIGTVILPNADIKIFLTASPEVRAKRRYDEVVGDYKNVLAEMRRRDFEDINRACAPLKMAEDAVLVDNSYMDFAEQLDAIYTLVLDRITDKGCRS